jgi:hypothetical protein
MQLKNAIQLGLKKGFGIMGSAIPVDLLQFKQPFFYLRTSYDCGYMIRGTLPTVTEYAGEQCCISIQKSSPSLASISI